MTQPFKMKVDKPVVPKKKPDVAVNAIPTFTTACGTDALKITTTRASTKAMVANVTDWALATDLQGAVKAWNVTTDEIEKTSSLADSYRAQYSATCALLLGLRLKWAAEKRHVLSTANIYCGGSVAKVAAFGMGQLVHGMANVGILVPSGIVTGPGAVAGEGYLSWDDTVNRHGFMVQWCVNPADVATYSATIPCTTGHFTLEGQPSGATRHYRIAAVDPALKGHVTEWSAWIAGTVL